MDAVFCFGVLHHVPDWQAALGELARVLKPGGVLYLEEIYPAVYLNPITRHLLLHPSENRFQSQDLHAALQHFHFRIRAAKEHRAVGHPGRGGQRSVMESMATNPFEACSTSPPAHHRQLAMALPSEAPQLFG